MTLNDLYHRQQVSNFRADHAACDRSRQAHLGMAAGYLAQIKARRVSQEPAR